MIDEASTYKNSRLVGLRRGFAGYLNIDILRGTLKNPMLNTLHGDAHKSRFSNALIIMELRIRT